MQHIPDDEVSNDKSPFLTLILHIKENLSKDIALIVIVYSIFITTINVGYINRVGYWVAPLFSISDYFAVNYEIISSLLLYVGIYAIGLPIIQLINGIVIAPIIRLFWIVIGKIGNPYRVYRFLDTVRQIPSEYLRIIITSSGVIGGIISLQLIAVFLLINNIPKGYGIFIDVFPAAFIIFFINKKLVDILNESNSVRFTHVFFVCIAILNTLTDLGRAWAHNDSVSSANIVSAISSDGVCANFHLMRGLSTGYIVYSDYSNSFEYRKIDKIHSMTRGKNCI